MPSQRHSLKYLAGQNRSFVRWLLYSLAMILVITSVACHAAVRQKQQTLDNNVSQTMYRLSYEYRSMTENFWQIYQPLFTRSGEVSSILNHYFHADSPALSPVEKQDLQYALAQMAAQDSRIDWIVVWSPARSVNYIVTMGSNNSLYELPADFPYLPELPESFSGMENLGVYDLSDLGVREPTFALCGGVPRGMGKGLILAGYRTSSLTSNLHPSHFQLEGMRYYLLSDEHVIFSSDGTNDISRLYRPEKALTGVVKDPDGHRLYTVAANCGSNTSYLVMICPHGDVLLFWYGTALLILAAVFLFIILSCVLFAGMLQTIMREVGVIRDGLELLGNNQLNHRIEGPFQQNGLSEIATSVNHMAERLQETLIREKDYQLRQKEAELSDLQSKFNPHFLYNTLEMLRGRCLASGNEDVAELITNLSSIFRSLIMKRSFISVSEELAGSRRYLNLFAARYGDRVEFQFDIDSDVLQYGIIPNVFQPLIENYFQYGFNVQEEGNYIRLCGASIDDEHFMLAVEDNGVGMSDEAIETMNATLQTPISSEKESYGLKNLHQRLSLYYGSDCGVHVRRSDDGGLCVQMIVRKTRGPA